MTLRKHMIVDQNGRIVIQTEDLKPGQSVEVTIRIEDERPRPSLLRFLGAGKGAFPDPKSADQFLRNERNQWRR